MKKWSELNWYQRLLETLFGGCPGCKYSDREHIVEMSYIHVNRDPQSEPPVKR